MTELLTVPVKAVLTEIEEFLLDNILDYGIIAGGFAAYLYNPQKKHSDIDLFAKEQVDSEAYDKLYHALGAKMSYWKKLKWRMAAEHPQLSKYNENVTLQALNIYDYTKRGKPGHHSQVQLVTTVDKEDPRHSTAESILRSFDWNVCKASVLDKRTLLVDKQFIEDMEANRVTFRPYPPRKTMNDDYGWRLFKYVEFKGYDMPFKDMLTVYGLVSDKKKFYDQIFRSGHTIKNKNLLNFQSFIQMMNNNDPEWQSKQEAF